MKIFIATTRTQRGQLGDRHLGVEGELVQLKRLCADGRGDPAGGRCLCARSFSGLNSHRATTTAMVADLPLSMIDYVEAVRSSLEQQGYCHHVTAEAGDEAAELVGLAAEWPVGTVVRRQGEWLDFAPPSLRST